MAPSKTQPALLGGLAIGVLSALPVINIANCCCAWILFGGALAAYLMQQNHPEPIGAGDGAIVGLMAGMFGAVTWAVISVPMNAAMAPLQSAMFQRMLSNTNDLPPEARAFFESISGPPVIGIGMIFFFCVMLFVCSLFGMIGGLFGALIFRKNAPPPPPPPAGPTFSPPTFTPPPIPGDGG